ncbi:MAG: methyltransferase domain-containing protein [Planctomycetota bacterium]
MTTQAEKTSGLDWSELYAQRRRVQGRYRRVWTLPVKKRIWDVAREYLKEGGSVLDVGAHERKLERFVKRDRPKASYHSMDIDRRLPHDYYSLDDVDRQFDLIVMCEVIEHLGLVEGGELVQKLARLTKPGGHVLLTTPNVFCPGQYLRDATHKTPYCYDELGGLMILAGLEPPELFRIYNAPALQRALRLGVFVWLHRYLGVDFAGTIVAVARQGGAS